VRRARAAAHTRPRASEQGRFPPVKPKAALGFARGDANVGRRGRSEPGAPTRKKQRQHQQGKSKTPAGSLRYGARGDLHRFAEFHRG